MVAGNEVNSLCGDRIMSSSEARPESGNAGDDGAGRKPYLDRLTMSAHKSPAGQPWEGLLLQPVSIPNLDHIGIRSSLSGMNSNSHEYISGDPLSGDAIRTIILEKKPLQKDKPRRLKPLDSAEEHSQAQPTSKNFQKLLSSAYGF